jgi:spore coat protein H
MPGGPGGMMQPLSLSLSEVDDKWPLIRFLMDDPVYRDIYHHEMRKAMFETFNETAVTAKMRRLHQMIRPYVVGTEGEISGYTFLTDGATEFDQTLTDLLDHVSARQSAVREYLQSIR